jgi:hypothetical protein
MDQILSYVSEIVSFLVGALAGSLLTFYFKNLRASSRANVVDQSEAKAGGDIVGRDKITK